MNVYQLVTQLKQNFQAANLAVAPSLLVSPIIEEGKVIERLQTKLGLPVGNSHFPPSKKTTFE